MGDGAMTSSTASRFAGVMANPAGPLALYHPFRPTPPPSAESIIGSGVAESVLLDAAVLLSSYDFANILPDTAPAVMVELCRLLALKTQTRDVFGGVVVCEPGSDVEAAWLELIEFDMQKYLSLCKSLTHGPTLGRRRGDFNEVAFAATVALYQRTFGVPLPVALWRSRSQAQTPAQAPAGRKQSETHDTHDGTSPPGHLPRDWYERPAEEPSAPVAAPPPAHAAPAPEPPAAPAASHGVKRESDNGNARVSKKAKAPPSARSTFRLADWLQLKVCSATNGCINAVTLLQTLKAEFPDVAKEYKSESSCYVAFARCVPRDPNGNALVTTNTTTREFRLTDAGRAYVATLNGAVVSVAAPPAQPPAQPPVAQFSLLLYARPDLTELRLRVNVRPDTTLGKVVRAVAKSLSNPGNVVDASAVTLALAGQVLTESQASCADLGLAPDNNRLHLVSPAKE